MTDNENVPPNIYAEHKKVSAGPFIAWPVIHVPFAAFEPIEGCVGEVVIICFIYKGFK